MYKDKTLARVLKWDIDGKNGFSELLWIAITGIVSLCASIIVLKLWHRDLRIPFEYTSDALGMFAEVKKAVQEVGIFDSGNVGAPFFDMQFAIQKGYFLHLLVIKFIAIFTDNFGLVINLFYLLTYPLTAIFAYYTIRKFQISPVIAMVGGVLYSCLPYHFFRGELHLTLAAYYLIPLACIAIFSLSTGELSSEEYRELPKISKRQLLQSMKTRRMIFSILICFLVGISDIYYSVFLLIILAFAMLFAVFETRQRRHLFFGGMLMLSLSAGLFIVFLPSILYGISNERNILYATGRSLAELDVYGLRITQLLLPIQGHRINFLANLREQYDSSATYINENSDASLGFVMAAGFVCSVLAVFFRSTADRCHENLNKLGKLNLFIVLISTVGGLNIFVGMFLTSDIRCYNRMCIFIAMFSIIAICTILDVLYRKIKKTGLRFLFCMGCVGIMVFGVADQTSASWATQVSHIPTNNTFRMTVDETKQEFLSDEAFVKSIEATVDDDAMILELPITAHTAYDQFPNGVEGSYDFYKPFLLSTKTKWSYGGILFGKSDNWLYSVSNLAIKDIMVAASIMDFSGIYIDPRGYQEVELETVISYIESVTGETPIRSSIKGLYFYNIENYAKTLRSEYSDEEWQALKKLYENIDLNCFSSFNFNIHFLGESRREEDSVTLLPGALQFGPYVSLLAGTYQITVIGENLNAATVYCNADNGTQSVNIQIKETSDTKIVYQITLQEKTENVEFCLQNSTNSEIKFGRIYCEQIKEHNQVMFGEYFQNSMK